MIHIFLFLAFTTINGHLLYNKTKLYTNKWPLTGLIEVERYPVKVIFSGKSAFELILNTQSGESLHFKAKHVSYVGSPTYYHINNIDSHDDKITFSIYQIEKDWFKLLSIVMTIIVFFVLIFYKRDHKISQICLFILLLIEILKSSDYDKTANRIVHKILF